MSKFPTYCKQKRSNGLSDLAFTSIQGERYYLGIYNSPESRVKFAKLLAEYQASGFTRPKNQTITVKRLLALFLEHAKNYYRGPSGGPTQEVQNFKAAMRPFVRIYGDELAGEFGPLKLKTVRDLIVNDHELGWSRPYINKSIGRIKHIFKWAAENELVDGNVYHALQAVAPLKRGRTTAPETVRVQPVAEGDIEAIRHYVSDLIWDMIQVQLLTGARPAEICTMRPCDINMSDPTVWLYCPEFHKNWHRDQGRTICIGPQAKNHIQPHLLGKGGGEYVFQPKDALNERYATAASHRRKNQKPNPRKTNRTIGICYDTSAYRKAIQRGCQRAGIIAWSPNQLRHNRGTDVRKQYGLDASQAVLGHRSLETTQIYAEKNLALAVKVAREIG